MTGQATCAVSGVRRNASAAIHLGGRLAGACEEGRVTRIRDVGMAGGFPAAAVAAAAEAAGLPGSTFDEIVTAEEGVPVSGASVRRLDHHEAHAATAFLTAPADEAVVLVCDTTPAHEVSLWHGRGRELRRIEFPWRGQGFSGIYSRLTSLMGLVAGQDEYRVESLAKMGPDESGPAAALLSYRDDAIVAAPGFDAFVERDRGSIDGLERVAGAVQSRLGELLREVLGEVVRTAPSHTLCLGGGLFYNTYFTTVVTGSGLFERVFVPVNPGNAGLCAGAALLGGLERQAGTGRPAPASPFLGPEYSNQQIKSVLDNCKLQYEFLDDFALVGRAVEALAGGELVGWFRGRLEWGPRALGNRSILANPFAPYVLENLNRFLKHRPPHRSYGLAVCAEDAAALFEGPAASPFMENEYRPRDRDRFAGIAPPALRKVRVQTVHDDPPALRLLLKTFGQAAGTPVLVNTSFNGLHEPIVCSPRDAVRVFYGTGLDLLCVGNFLLRK